MHGALIYGSAVTEQRLLANSVDEKRKGRPTEQADLRMNYTDTLSVLMFTDSAVSCGSYPDAWQSPARM